VGNDYGNVDFSKKISLPISTVNVKIHNEERKEVLSFLLEIGCMYRITHCKPDTPTFIKHYFDELRKADNDVEDEDKIYNSFINFSPLPRLNNSIFVSITDSNVEKTFIKNKTKYNESNYSSWIMPHMQRNSKDDIFSLGNELPIKYKTKLLTSLLIALGLSETKVKEEVNILIKLIDIEGKDASTVLI
jgi:hypothetical protein